MASGGSGGNSDANSRSGVGARGSGRRPPSGGVIGSEISGPSRISPGEYVNTDVTAPAALAALALMHMRYCTINLGPCIKGVVTVRGHVSSADSHGLQGLGHVFLY